MLPTLQLGGAWQMALDDWLLDQDRPALRLYRWQRPCLSLGRHQRRFPAAWLRLAAQGTLELVRRPSGGGAVLHGGDLTYALVWPDPPSNRFEAYRRASRWLQEAFLDLGQPLRFGNQRATLAAPSCFATHTAADLVQGAGLKRIGSAQLWRGGCLLQHGSIQLAADGGLWRDVFGSDPPDLPSLPVAGERLEEVLLTAARRWLPLPPLRLEHLGAQELAAVASGLDQFRLVPTPAAAGVAVSGSLTSPAASIERTT
ncbi:lipoate--protein ligase family protein [Cyanobium sp. CH-040]|nr:lipoate--protein ligase family protein [Cyanobium sp. CH-040]